LVTIQSGFEPNPTHQFARSVPNTDAEKANLLSSLDRNLSGT